LFGGGRASLRLGRFYGSIYFLWAQVKLWCVMPGIGRGVTAVDGQRGRPNSRLVKDIRGAYDWRIWKRGEFGDVRVNVPSGLIWDGSLLLRAGTFLLKVGRSVVMGSSASLGRAPAPPHVTSNTSSFHDLCICRLVPIGYVKCKRAPTLRDGSP
jgi:hypothetical protein